MDSVFWHLDAGGGRRPVHHKRPVVCCYKGDLDRYAVWKRILRAVEEIQRTDPADDEPIH